MITWKKKVRLTLLDCLYLFSLYGLTIVNEKWVHILTFEQGGLGQAQPGHSLLSQDTT